MMMQHLEHYLLARRSAGYKMQKHECLLRGYARQADAACETHVRRETAIAWASQSKTPGQRERRLAYLIRFARWLHVEDPKHEIPPSGVFSDGKNPRRMPKIYSPQEIQLIMDAALKLPSTNPLRPRLYWTLFGLLAATGLRISEALNLTFDDITPDGLVIRQTKFRKSRLVPIDESVRAALDAYIALRRKIGGGQPFLFLSRRKQRLSYHTVLSTFLRLVKRLKMHDETGNVGARLHDFRHTFAVRALERAPKAGADVASHILALSTYLGHACVANTYWYLHTSPELLDGIADACERLMREDAS